MFNPNLYRNKSYDMNFKHKKYELYAFITSIKSVKFMSYDLFFYKFGSINSGAYFRKLQKKSNLKSQDPKKYHF